MGNPKRPHSSKNVPDPARAYERANPEHESGMGRMDNNQGTPSSDADRMQQAVPNAKETGQSGESKTPSRASPAQRSESAPRQPDHSMHEEEPDGWDMAPMDIHKPRKKRHPRREGKGGTP